MYHLRLTKALSYTGIVEATKDKPDVYVEYKATADAAVASGYFKLVEEEPGSNPTEEPGLVPGHLDEDQLNTMNVAELKKLAAEMEVDLSGRRSKADIIAAIIAQEVYAPAASDFDPEALAEMSEEELTAYAEENGISLEGCNGREDILEAISVANCGSYTMLDLQRE